MVGMKDGDEVSHLHLKGSPSNIGASRGIHGWVG